MPDWTPRDSIERECGRRGRTAFVDGCRALIRGRPADDELLLAVGGPAATRFVGADDLGVNAYWPRVWGCRGLLWAYEPRAQGDVLHALDDPHWRVREMACRTVARHRVGDAIDRVAALRSDPVERVRRAADRAAATLVAQGA